MNDPVVLFSRSFDECLHERQSELTALAAAQYPGDHASNEKLDRVSTAIGERFKQELPAFVAEPAGIEAVQTELPAGIPGRARTRDGVSRVKVTLWCTGDTSMLAFRPSGYCHDTTRWPPGIIKSNCVETLFPLNGTDKPILDRYRKIVTEEAERFAFHLKSRGEFSGPASWVLKLWEQRRAERAERAAAKQRVQDKLDRLAESLATAYGQTD